MNPWTDADKRLPPSRRGKPSRAATARPRAAASPEHRLLECAELLFFAYRDFTRDPDTILKDFGFGRAHHRVLHFVNRHSGLRVADLLDILTHHQAEPVARAEAADRQGLYRAAGRARPIAASGCCSRPTRAARWPSGWRRRRSVRLAAALKQAGPGAEAVVRRFLEAMVNAEERPKVSSIMAASPVPLKEGGKGKAHDHADADQGPSRQQQPRRQCAAYSGGRRRQPHPRSARRAICKTTASASPRRSTRRPRAPAMRSLAFDLLILDVMMPQSPVSSSPARCATSPTCRS